MEVPTACVAEEKNTDHWTIDSVKKEHHNCLFDRLTQSDYHTTSTRLQEDTVRYRRPITESAARTARQAPTEEHRGTKRGGTAAANEHEEQLFEINQGTR